MYFVGQKHIMGPLQLMLPQIYEEKLSATFLFRGPSGYGKTKLSLMICNYLTAGDFDFSLADKWSFDPTKWVHFIDEVHLLNPPEVIYPIIDSKKYVILLATNDAATLPEALVNRTMEFIFAEYSVEELRYIAGSILVRALPISHLDYLIQSSAKNPRIMKGLCERINLISRAKPTIWDMSFEEFKVLMRELFGIVDGLDVASRRYVEALDHLGGRASLDTLATYLHIDKDTLRYFVEPILLYRNLILITSRGRILCQK